MVKMQASYSGGLHCEVLHMPSQSQIETDAPKDNLGRGERFSPTDLMGAALVSCILTTMAIVAEREGIHFVGVRASVAKEMVSVPSRKVGSLNVQVTLPSSISQGAREKLQWAAQNCPVKRSLHPEIQAQIEFSYEL